MNCAHQSRLTYDLTEKDQNDFNIRLQNVHGTREQEFVLKPLTPSILAQRVSQMFTTNKSSEHTTGRMLIE